MSKKILFCRFILFSLMASQSAYSQQNNSKIDEHAEWIPIKCLKFEEITPFENNLITSMEAYHELYNFMWDTAELFDFCQELPTVDFDKYSLVTVRTWFGGCYDDIDLKPVYQISNDQALLNFQILGDVCRAHVRVVFFIQIPKVNHTNKIILQRDGLPLDSW